MPRRDTARARAARLLLTILAVATAAASSAATDVRRGGAGDRDTNANGIPDRYEKSPFDDFRVHGDVLPAGVKAFYFPPPEEGRPFTVAVLHSPAVRVQEVKVEPGDEAPLIAGFPTATGTGTFVDFEMPPDVPGDSVRITVRLDHVTLTNTVAVRRAGRGGSSTSIVRLPEVVRRVPPAYPAAARADGISGTVLVQALVGEDGRAKDVRVLRSIPGLDEAAMKCVRHWTFRPATSNGRPVAVWVAVPVGFVLH